MEKSDIKALTFDLFGTILDLGGSLTPYIAEFLEAKGADVSADRFWDQWRARQRIEQYQDTLVMLGHSGYLETVRRAFVYVLNLNGIQTLSDEVKDFMGAWDQLSPFPEVLPALGTAQISLPVGDSVEWRSAFLGSSCKESGPVGF